MPAPLALPLMAIFKQAAGAALRSGALGGGVGGVARTWKTYGEAAEASATAAASPGNKKAIDEATKATKNFAISLGTSISPIASSLKDFKDGMDSWRDSLVEGQKGLIAFNNSIATAYTELGVADTERRLALGKATAGTAKALIESENSRRNSLLNQEAFWANANNRLATIWNQANTVLNTALEPIYGTLNELVDIETKAEGGQMAGTQALMDLARENEREFGSRPSDRYSNGRN